MLMGLYIKAKRNVRYSIKFSELARHFQPYDASKSNERHRYLLNKLKSVAVVSCLYVTNKISFPSYSLQITSFKTNIH